MANISKVYLLNTPLEDDMKNTLYFTNETAQKSYMDNNVIRSYTNVSYQRDTSTFRCPTQIDQIRNCNYIMFQNTAYSNKWFYGFIKKMVYINDSFTDVQFEVDPLQTFMFDITVRPSFVEREHTNDDTVGANTLPENVELGPYVKNINIGTPQIGPNTMWYAVAVSEVLGSLSTMPASMINGLPNGLFYVFTDNVSTLHTIARIYDDAGKAQAIYSMFAFPKQILYIQQGDSGTWAYSSATWTYNGNTFNTSTNVYVPSSNSIIGTLVASYTLVKPDRVGLSYTPRNAKLLTFPYCYFNISNNSGSTVTYHYEDFSGNPNFKMVGVLSNGCSTKLYPTNYKNMTIFSGDVQDNPFDYGVTGGKYPTISWNSDSFTNWLTQNSLDIATNLTMSTLGTLGAVAGGMATGNPLAFYGAYTLSAGAITNAVKQVHDAQFIPDQAKGNTNVGDLNFTAHKNKFTVMPLSIKPEYARIIDDYFDLLGYQTNRVKTPNYAHRQNWWYTKTIDCNITGNVPNDYMNRIKQAYNNGLTFWRNPSNFLNYSVSNGIV